MDTENSERCEEAAPAHMRRELEGGCKARKGTLLILAGALCVFAAMALTAYNLWDQQRAGLRSEEALSQLAPGGGGLPRESLDGSIGLPVKTVDGYRYVGTLYLDALGLALPVQDAVSEDGLRVSPCRYVGSPYSGDMVVAAHNYTVHFGRIKRLVPGDAVRFVDMDGNEFCYEVSALDVLDPYDVKGMVEPSGWNLTLFTCTFGGASRITVRCVGV